MGTHIITVSPRNANDEFVTSSKVSIQNNSHRYMGVFCFSNHKSKTDVRQPFGSSFTSFKIPTKNNFEVLGGMQDEEFAMEENATRDLDSAVTAPHITITNLSTVSQVQNQCNKCTNNHKSQPVVSNMTQRSKHQNMVTSCSVKNKEIPIRDGDKVGDKIQGDNNIHVNPTAHSKRLGTLAPASSREWESVRP